MRSLKEEKFTVGDEGIARLATFTKIARSLHFEDGEEIYAILEVDTTTGAESLAGFRVTPLTLTVIQNYHAKH